MLAWLAGLCWVMGALSALFPEPTPTAIYLVGGCVVMALNYLEISVRNYLQALLK